MTTTETARRRGRSRWRSAAFLPDVATIERLANAFFKGVNGGAPPAPPAIAAIRSRAMVAAFAAARGAIAQDVPVQPPFGFPDPPASSAPASAPLRSFGGASAGSAAPLRDAGARASCSPAAAQTLVSPPRVDPTSTLGAPIDEAPVSPFAAEIDLRAALADAARRLRRAARRPRPFGAAAGAPRSAPAPPTLC